MLPEIGASVISGGAGLISGLIQNHQNVKAQKLANQTAIQLWQDQRDYNTQMYNQTLADNRQTWQQQFDETNAYNDPSAARARLEDAGFNPYLAISSDAAGTASSGSLASGDLQTNQPPQIAPVVSHSADAVNSAFQSAISTYQTIGQLANQTKATNAGVDYTRQQSLSSLLGNMKSAIESPYWKSNAQNDYWDKRNNTLRLDMQTELDNMTLQDKIDSSHMQRNILEANLSYQLMQNDAKSLLNEFLPGTLTVQYLTQVQSLKNLVAQGQLTWNEARNAARQWYLINANINNVNADTSLKGAETIDTLHHVAVTDATRDNLDSSTQLNYANMDKVTQDSRVSKSQADLADFLFDSACKAGLATNKANEVNALRRYNRDYKPDNYQNPNNFGNGLRSAFDNFGTWIQGLMPVPQ